MSTLDEIAEAARLRYMRWDPAVWQLILDGPAQVLSANLLRLGKEEEARAVITAYLRLASHGVGNGYLFDAQRTGAESFFVRAWFELLPTRLAELPHNQRGKALQDCWNLAENLETSPPWLRMLFLHRTRSLNALTDLDALVQKISRAISDAPERDLASGWEAQWISLRDADPRFLPGAMHFLSPTLLAVRDRLRTDSQGNPYNIGIWLDDEPMILGSLGPQEIPEPAIDEASNVLWQTYDDPRFTEIFSSVGNQWRAAATLVTSQSLVVLCPT